MIHHRRIGDAYKLMLEISTYPGVPLTMLLPCSCGHHFYTKSMDELTSGSCWSGWSLPSLPTRYCKWVEFLDFGSFLVGLRSKDERERIPYPNSNPAPLAYPNFEMQQQQNPMGNGENSSDTSSSGSAPTAPTRSSREISELMKGLNMQGISQAPSSAAKPNQDQDQDQEQEQDQEPTLCPMCAAAK